MQHSELTPVQPSLLRHKLTATTTLCIPMHTSPYTHTITVMLLAPGVLTWAKAELRFLTMPTV